MPGLEVEITTLRFEVRRWLWRLLLGTALLLPLAWIVFVLAWSDAAGSWTGPLLATPVYVAIGLPLLSSGIRRFREPAHRGDLLLAAGVTLAYAAGLWQFSSFMRETVERNENLDAIAHNRLFADATLILTFVALGKYLQAAALERALNPLRELLDLPAENTICVRQGEQTLVPTDRITPGETILIRPGQRIPLDAQALSGASQIDQSWLTGEIRPVDCGPGSELFAGTLNGASPLIARVARPLHQSTPQRVIDIVRSGIDRPSKIEQRVDRLATWFVAAVALAAVATFVLWLVFSNLHDALEAATAVLLTAGVSAWALSASTAVAFGCGRGTLRGVILRGGAAVERASKLATVVLDKSAAITPGLPAVVELIPCPGVRSEELLATAAAAAQFSDDPIAVSIVAEARRRELRLPVTRSHELVADQGIAARTLTGDAVLGLDSWLTTLHVDVSPLVSRLAALRAAGQTPWVVAVGTRLFGVIATAHAVAPYSRQAVGQLRALGFRVVLLSADSPAVTAATAREVTFDEVIADVSAERQAEVIATIERDDHPVAMVGSGDTLCAGDLKVALGTGGHVDVATADIVVPGDLRGVSRAVLLSRTILGAIWANLGFAIALNVLLIPLAAAGKLLPVVAAAATAVASVVVVANSLIFVSRRID